MIQEIQYEKFIEKKSTDTAVIYGSGWSVNLLTSEQKERYSKLDSFSFNWFCKSQIPVKFYMLREQASTPSRSYSSESLVDLYREMNHLSYRDTTLFVSVSGYEFDESKYFMDLSKFNQSEYIVALEKKKDMKSRSSLWIKMNPFKDKIYHGMASLTNVLHAVVFMGYKEIIFVGVDLKDSRYFWLKEDQTRRSVKIKGKKFNSSHSTRNYALDMIKFVQTNYCECSVSSIYSELSRRMKVDGV